MEKHYKFIIAAVFFLIIAAIFFLISYKPALAPENFNIDKMEEIKIGGKIIRVEIADSAEKQIRGLSGRRSLPDDQGMLFVFPALSHYSFWMKDMNFSLDFIWIKEDEVVEITKNVKPEDYQPPSALSPINTIDKVLEINAGMAEKLGIKEGDKVDFSAY